MKLNINLLSEEFKIAEVKRTKFYRVQSIGVGIVLTMVFLSSLTVALRFLQSQNLKNLQSRVSAASEKITDLKDTQKTLIFLKDRLNSINQYIDHPSKQSQMYNLAAEVLPKSIAVTSLSVGQTGDILVLATARDADSLDRAVADLTTTEEGKEKVGQVIVDGVSRGREGIYRLTLKIKPKV